MGWGLLEVAAEKRQLQPVAGVGGAFLQVVSWSHVMGQLSCCGYLSANLGLQSTTCANRPGMLDGVDIRCCSGRLALRKTRTSPECLHG